MSKILFVFEGLKEMRISSSLTNFFVNEGVVVQCAFCAEIYQLFEKIHDDEFLDTFELLKGIEVNKEILSPFTRDDFGEIYLFFDYDGHATKADDNKILEMLAFFSNETDSGKLYLSYPMLESLWHIPKEGDFESLKVSAKENIKYKGVVGSEAIDEFKKLNSYTKDTWLTLIDHHLCKMNYIVKDDFSFPIEKINQPVIFASQLNKYILKDQTVAVLSSFPVFLFDYYKLDDFLYLLNKKERF